MIERENFCFCFDFCVCLELLFYSDVRRDFFPEIVIVAGSRIYRISQLHEVVDTSLQGRFDDI